MVIAGSFWRKVVVTAVAAVGFVSLYEATMLDSKEATLGGTASATSVMPPPEPGTRLSFTGTAYCSRAPRRGCHALPTVLDMRQSLPRTSIPSGNERAAGPRSVAPQLPRR